MLAAPWSPHLPMASALNFLRTQGCPCWHPPAGALSLCLSLFPALAWQCRIRGRRHLHKPQFLHLSNKGEDTTSLADG